MTEIVLGIQAIVLAGAAVLFYYMRKQAKALHGTVQGQADHIASLRTLGESIKTVMDSTDERRMLERLKTHKEFVEYEMEAATKRQASTFAEERGKLMRTSAMAVLAFGRVLATFGYLISELLPHCPPDRRLDLLARLDSVSADDDYERQLIPIILDPWRESLNRIAIEAPDLSFGLGRLTSFSPNTFPLLSVLRAARAGKVAGSEREPEQGEPPRNAPTQGAGD